MKIKILRILIILIYILLAISCKREKDAVLQQEEKDENIGTEHNVDSKSNAKKNDGQAITLNPSESAVSSSQRTRTVPVIESNNYLLYEQNMDIVTPEDFEIGPLLVFSNRIGDEVKNKKYLEFINKFFYELRTDTIPSSMISEENLFFLTNIFNSYIEKKQIPDNIRIGKVIRTKDGLRLNLRMFKEKNRTEGEIILLETKNGFEVKEFYGDLGMLDVEYSRGDERFEPEIYKF
ncbi:MAG: hypothetical protein FWF38_04425 [Spirochaetaceae bacterium]|nr:hypothetical protein [Spirochaetaceae bacterium]